MSIASIHIQKVSTGSFFHNDRSIAPAYAIDTNIKNECAISAKDAVEKYYFLRAEAQKNYIESTGQKMQKNTIFLKEAVINLNENHTLKDLEPIMKELESKGYTVLQASIHRDEGHIDEETGEKVKNLHAHITLFNLDKNGKSVKMGNAIEFAKLQTKNAEFLGMTRGATANRYEAKILGVEVAPRKLRLDTHFYKRAMEFKNVEKQKTNKIEKRLQEDKIAVNELARVFELRNLEKDKIYDPVSLIKAIKKKYEDMRKQYIAEGGRAKADYDALKKERDALILKIKEQEEHIKNQSEKLEQQSEHIKKQAEELEKTTEDLEKIDVVHAQIVGLIEAGASAEELREVVKMQQTAYKIKRPTYVNAKSRAMEAYKSKLKKPKEETERLLVSREQEQLDNSTRAHRNI